jgi:hypothetical protein
MTQYANYPSSNAFGNKDESNVQWSLHDRSAEQKALDRIERVSQVFSKYASVVTLRNVSCLVVPYGVSPVFATSRVIVYSANHLADITDPKNAMALKGLTLHEICHILFSARNGTSFKRIITKENLNEAYSIAEDSRIETLLIGRFGTNITAWLNASVFRHLLTPGLNLAVQFPVVAGRKYLPLAVRQELRNVFALPDYADEIESLLDEYRLMVWNDDQVFLRGLEVLRRLQEILNLLKDETGCSNIPTPNGHENRPIDELEPSFSRPLSTREQEQAQTNATKRKDTNEKGTNQKPPATPVEQQQPPQQPPICNFPMPPTNPGKNPTPTPTGESQDKEKGNEQGQDKGNDKGDSNGGDNSTPSEQETNGADKSKPPVEMNAALENAINDQWKLDLEKVKTEINKDIRDFKNDLSLQDIKVETPKKSNFTNKQVDLRTLSAGKQFGVELERIRTELEPNWRTRLDSGKINANRYLTEKDLDTTFDEWYSGQDEATDIEAVILLDNSGSMGGNKAISAYKSMFAIKQGLQAIGASCSVLTFNSVTSMLYEPHETAKGQVKDAGAGGGTDPLEALLYSQSVFAKTNRNVKILFVITDGEWSDNENCEQVISTLGSSGVITSLALIGNDFNGTTNHECLISSHIQHPDQLIGLAKSIVKVAIAKSLTK